MENHPSTKLKLNGYVTTFQHVHGRSHAELEQVLGFNTGSLSRGFHVYALCDSVGINDFEWKDQTSYSDGWHFDRSVDEYVQRRDELRAQYGKKGGYDDSEADRELDVFMHRQVKRLNVISGKNRIVKVIPSDRSRLESYPDSSIRGIPQWKLIADKNFILD